MSDYVLVSQGIEDLRNLKNEIKGCAEYLKDR